MRRAPKSSTAVWRPKVTINASAAETIDPAVAVEARSPPVKGEAHLQHRLGRRGTQNAPPQSREGGAQECAIGLKRSNSNTSLTSSKISSVASSVATGDSYSDFSELDDDVPMKTTVRKLVESENRNKTNNAPTGVYSECPTRVYSL